MTLTTKEGEAQMTDELLVEPGREKIARQEALENNAFAEGARRFYERLQSANESGRGSATGAALKLLKEGMEGLKGAIEEELTGPGKHAAGKRHVAAKWCKLIGPDVAAYITLKVVLDRIGSPARSRLQSVASEIANMILDELQYRRFKKKAPGLFEYKLKSFKTDNYAHKARSMSASQTFAKIDCDDLVMTPSQKVLVGTKLIGMLMDHLGICETERVSQRGNGRAKVNLRLAPTPETLEWMRKKNAVLAAAAQPIVMPMVLPPLGWSSTERGGFRYKLRGRYDLVRKFLRAGEPGANQVLSSVVYEAVNNLQNTAWRINRDVLAVVEELVAQGGGMAGIATMEESPLPAKPVDIATNPEARKAWRREASKVIGQNRYGAQHRSMVSRTLVVAREMQAETDFYFPHTLDFRGRVYPLAVDLTPQGNDLSRGLLTFAAGKPVDEEGARWLAIHGANCMGETPEGQKVSRMTLEERVAWIYTNTPAILKAADNPLVISWWMEADKPLQFLAFCFEWRNLIRANDRGEDYVCSLPCAMDGSCNGLQHFSALLRDDVGGRAVNLAAQGEPQDIYSAVSEEVLRQLQAAAAAGDELALLWISLHNRTGIVNRKLTKRPTMTFGYGSKEYGFTEQLAEYLKSHPDFTEIRHHFALEVPGGKDKPRLGQACETMSRMIWLALQEVVVAAFDGMAWMQEATKGITKRNKTVSWTVPITGFRVEQQYFDYRRRQIKTVLAGTLIYPSVWITGDKVNRRKQSNAVAPNIIHSLDAAALMLTVSQAFTEGVSSFAMVHDSYGTVPSDCAVLAACCRRSFVRLYTQHDVIGLLYNDLRSQWDDPDQCPVPPSKGSLDVSQVIASEYFFA